MKVGPLVRAFEKRAEVELRLVHTGQHYDEAMSQVFFRDLGLPEPHLNLEVGPGAAPEQTARLLEAFADVIGDWRPHLVIVVGDVTSTVACALAATQCGVPVAHVEAGLRSFDRSMPEERNRIVTDHLSELLFTTEKSGNENLEREGIPRSRVRFVGNVMIDSLLSVKKRAARAEPWTRWGLEADRFILVTLHRPSNVDVDTRLRELVTVLENAATKTPVLFPVHPRTRLRIQELGLLSGSSVGVQMVDPIGYIDFVGMMSGAALVVTDSGGVQEETTALGVPCLTVRPSTERPVTIEIGTNRLVTPDQPLEVAIEEALGSPRRERGVPELWDGQAGERIAEHVIEYLDRRAKNPAAAALPA